jgi:hypothetical protein
MKQMDLEHLKTWIPIDDVKQPISIELVAIETPKGKFCFHALHFNLSKHPKWKQKNSTHLQLLVRIGEIFSFPSESVNNKWILTTTEDELKDYFVVELPSKRFGDFSRDDGREVEYAYTLAKTAPGVKRLMQRDDVQKLIAYAFKPFFTEEGAWSDFFNRSPKGE